MSKGQIFPSEASTEIDSATGARVTQITRHPSVHHHPFFFVPPWDDAMRRLIFVSHRTGHPQLFARDEGNGLLLQLTDRDDLAEWSFHPSHDGRHVFFVAGTAAWRLDLETLAEQQLANFGNVAMRAQGMVGAAMGTTTLSRDDRWWAVPVKTSGGSQFHVLDTASGADTVILERDTIGHPQFCPDDPGLLFYAGPHRDRLWLIERDGTHNRRLWQREHDQQWLVHESWVRGTREVAFVDWPHGMRAVHADSGAMRRITEFPAWHAQPDDSGELFVCDTNLPDIGLHVFPARVPGRARRICLSRASSIGAHWNAPFPYNDGPKDVYAPQHTHPHPRFSPDGRRVLFTSDASGHAQLFECLLPEDLQPQGQRASRGDNMASPHGV